MGRRKTEKGGVSENLRRLNRHIDNMIRYRINEIVDMVHAGAYGTNRLENLENVDFLEGIVVQALWDNEETQAYFGDQNIPPPAQPQQAISSGEKPHGEVSNAIREHFFNKRRSDSPKNLGQDSRVSLVKNTLKEDALQDIKGDKRIGWRPGKALGAGLLGKVILWEKVLHDGSTVRLVTKDSLADNAQAKHEGQLIRRLNDVGCRNVIKVLEWTFIPKSTSDISGKDDRASKFRICYEYAEFGDLQTLLDWYDKHSLVLPEAFVWHVVHSIVNALCYCRHGTNVPNPLRPVPGWQQIIHGDVQPGNILMAGSVDKENRLYPCLKLGDFGLAHPIDEPMLAARAHKSSSKSGTHSFVAPEISRAERYKYELGPHELHGSQSDIYSLGFFIQELCGLANRHMPKKVQASEPEPTYYSGNLTHLIQMCCSRKPVDRPQIHDLYRETRIQMTSYKAQAYAEESQLVENTDSTGLVFQSQVLWYKPFQRLYETNMSFRRNYQAVNLHRIRKTQ